MKKSWLIVLSMWLMFVVLPLQVSAASEEWDGTCVEPQTIVVKDTINYYQITKAEELAYIAQTGGDWLRYNYILANDIVLNTEELTYDAEGDLTADAEPLNKWTPIDDFEGIFDGAGHSISGVYVDREKDAGFFGVFEGTLKNLTLKNVYVTGKTNVGGIAGTLSGNDTEGCVCYGAVRGEKNVGGIAGRLLGIYIKDSKNHADVWASGDYAGGIVGYLGTYGIDNCVNYGDVTGEGSYTGGITSYCHLYGFNACTNHGAVKGKDYVGGMAGYISDCYTRNNGNTGTVTGENYVGGLVGYVVNGSNVTYTSDIFTSYNSGEIKGKENVGGLCGFLDYSNLYDCYNVGNVEGETEVGAVVGHSETIWCRGEIKGCYYLKSDTVNKELKGFGNFGDAEGIVRDKQAGFFPIVSDPEADPSYEKLGYKNGEVDEPIEEFESEYPEPEKETQWDGSTLEPTVLTSIDGICYYKIYTGKELAYIAQTGGDWLRYNYILANDIVLNTEELTYDAEGDLTADEESLNKWTPIDDFEGIFDGAGHSISGVYVDREKDAGFFGVFEGTLKNLTLKNVYVTGKTNVGGIAGTLSGNDTEGCVCYGAVRGEKNVGGIAGMLDGIYIKDSKNHADVWASGDYAGGIVGYLGTYGIDNCVNYGDVTGEGSYTGGITSYCYLYGFNACTNHGAVKGKDYVGGMAGYISDCYTRNNGNTGTVTGENYVGGLVGYVVNGSNVIYTSDIFTSYNSGEIKGKENVGGLCGFLDYSNLYDSYNVGNVEGETEVGAVVGHSETIWGRGEIENCCYLKNDIANKELNGFGNAEDIDGVTNSKEKDFFCVNDKGIVNMEGHAYEKEETPSSGTIEGKVTYTCENCGYSYWESLPIFTDVSKTEYYYNPVLWAVKEGITTGMTATTFAPDNTCSRAQAVTFLWRAAGSPKMDNATMLFKDVPANEYYKDAVLWAVKEGITTGTTAATFSPDMKCSRAQIVTFLWRFRNSPTTATSNPFHDVPLNEYYGNAVLWAVKEGITTGITATAFGPDMDCSRGQIVTFLYRNVAE